jgi:hypothetical protein
MMKIHHIIHLVNEILTKWMMCDIIVTLLADALPDLVPHASFSPRQQREHDRSPMAAVAVGRSIGRHRR